MIRTSMEKAADAEEPFNMKCWYCRENMIWGADFDYEDYCLEGEGIVSNFSCTGCEATTEFYLPLNEDK